MTEKLSSAELEKLLKECTPGPWHHERVDYEEDVSFEVLAGEADEAVNWYPPLVAQTIMRETKSEQAHIRRDEVNAELIALAPTLARELLSLREAAQNVIDSAVSDSDSCPICLQDVVRHSDGCSIAILKSALPSPPSIQGDSVPDRRGR